MIEVLHRASRLRGIVRLPGDKSISHRYALIAALSEGSSDLQHYSSSEDCHGTLRCLRSLGVPVEIAGTSVKVRGVGLHGLKAPNSPLDAGNSGTTVRLLSGILAGQPFESRIGGDDSLSKRPMNRIIEPLSRMGARIEARPDGLPPLRIRGGSLSGIRYALPVASAQVKSCVLLAGLYADSPTSVFEEIPTRDHTEIALEQFGATVRREEGWITVLPRPSLGALQLDVPGDLSGAAFFLVAAALVPGSEIVMPEVGMNHRRRELLSYLESAGLDLSFDRETSSAGEKRADLVVRHSPALLARPLPPIRGALTAALIDEIPALAVLGSCVAGGLEISDARELRVKESDRIALLASNLRAMGAGVEEKPEGLNIRGNARLRGAEIITGGDHRIAMAFSVAALAAEGETRIEASECASVSFPGFFEALKHIAE